MGEKRRRHTAEIKAEVLRKVLKEKRPVSEVCGEYGFQGTLFYTWQREAFERLEGLFEAPPDEKAKAEQAEVRELRERLHSKSIFCRELLEEHAKLKKSASSPKSVGEPRHG